MIECAEGYSGANAGVTVPSVVLHPPPVPPLPHPPPPLPPAPLLPSPPPPRKGNPARQPACRRPRLNAGRRQERGSDSTDFVNCVAAGAAPTSPLVCEKDTFPLVRARPGRLSLLPYHQRFPQ
jgi:hypothetical protein